MSNSIHQEYMNQRRSNTTPLQLPFTRSPEIVYMVDGIFLLVNCREQCYDSGMHNECLEKEDSRLPLPCTADWIIDPELQQLQRL